MPSPVPSNTKLYEKVKKEARGRFERWPSIYASAWVVKTYKSRGGKYKGKKPKESGINRWFDEEWVQVSAYLNGKKKVQCGAQNRSEKACRPLKRVDENTPITIPELLKLHSKKKLIDLARQKRSDMKGRLFWERGKFYPST